MTNWQPNIGARNGPRYLAIATALEEDIDEGQLSPGDRLPTHRDLAWRLGVTVGTITRAYAEAERRGLVAGEVGRGTFVRDRTPIDLPAPDSRGNGAGFAGFIDLAHNFPVNDGNAREVAAVLAELSAERGVASLLAYEMGFGRPEHRAAGAQWISESGLASAPENVVVSAGCQHAMLLALSAVTRPGDLVLTEELTFYGVKSIAALLDLRLQGVAMDDQGILPEALDTACRGSSAKALYCIPTLQNPTTSIMPEPRRREIARICERYEITIIEDDIYGFLPESAPAPLSSHAPERSIYVTSLSKCLAPGLRIGFTQSSAALTERIGQALRATTVMTSPLMAEAARRLIRDGRARQIAQWQRREAQARQQLARAALPVELIETKPEAFHLWLTLPEPWRREVFTAEARSRGVAIAPAEVFAVGRQPVPHAVRVCLQAESSRDRVSRALATLSDILAGAPASPLSLV